MWSKVGDGSWAGDFSGSGARVFSELGSFASIGDRRVDGLGLLLHHPPPRKRREDQVGSDEPVGALVAPSLSGAPDPARSRIRPRRPSRPPLSYATPLCVPPGMSRRTSRTPSEEAVGEPAWGWRESRVNIAASSEAARGPDDSDDDEGDEDDEGEGGAHLRFPAACISPRVGTSDEELLLGVFFSAFSAEESDHHGSGLSLWQTGRRLQVQRLLLAPQAPPARGRLVRSLLARSFLAPQVLAP